MKRLSVRLLWVLLLVTGNFTTLRAQLVDETQTLKSMNSPQSFVDEKVFVDEHLPDPFALGNGQRIETRAGWNAQRERIKAMLLFHQYGDLPPAPDAVKVVMASSEVALNGRARRERIVLECGSNDALQWNLELLIPLGKTQSFPVILLADAGETPIAAEVIERGYILAQFNRAQFAPDDASKNAGVYALHRDFEGGVLAAWAWGYSRSVDYLLSRRDVDSKRIAVTGHSRVGKAVLLAGALDERVALTVAAQSGSGGASPYRLRGRGSESLSKITARFGYWFHPRLKSFVDKENQLPFDQHFLMALVAPRGLLLLGALDDPYVNATATQASFEAAQEVWKWLDAENKSGITLREGGHSFGETDWRALLDFADWQFFERKPKTKFEGLSIPDAMLPFKWRAPLKR